MGDIAQLASPNEGIDVSDIVGWLESHPLGELQPLNREKYLDRRGGEAHQALTKRFHQGINLNLGNRPILT
jgi:hypothetical protein